MKTKFLFFTIIFILSLCNGSERVKRKIVFRKNTKMFLRVNGIEPFFEKYNTIFRMGYGFRANWPLPDDIETFHKLFTRDVHNDVNQMIKNPEFQDLICILQYFSKLVTNIKYNKSCKGGMLCNIAKIIKRSEGRDVTYFKTFFNKISNVEGFCPALYYVPLINNEIY